MKFATPATASEPYMADAESVRISMRSIAASGMDEMSKELVGPSKDSLCPSTKVKVESGPKPRRLTVDADETLLALAAPPAPTTPGFMPPPNACGILLIT